MNEQFLEGLISVETAVQATQRDIHTIYLQKGKLDPAFLRLEKLAASQTPPIAVQYVPAAFIAERVHGQSHGGVLAQVGPRRFLSLTQLFQVQKPRCLVMLDGVEDPFNFGQAIRALYAAGIDGLIVTARHWETAVATVTRASAGASEWMPTALTENALTAAHFCREQGLKIACTSEENATSLYQTNLTIPLFVLLGGEKRGISRPVMELADYRLTIPYGRPFPHALGTTTATAIFAFEWFRQQTHPQ